MSACLFGLETEYGFAAFDGRGRRVENALDAAEALCVESEACLRGAERGYFLPNGGRFYRDPGSSNAHQEIATPEVTNPTDAVLYMRAGDRFMQRGADRLRRKQQGGVVQASFSRHNVSYGNSPASWASHENFATTRSGEELAPEIAGFLVSRIVFCGAGGFDPWSPGLVFLVSSRAPFTRHVTGGGTQDERPLVNLRDEPLCNRGHRLHIISGESLNSQRALWLRVATTALVVALADAGLSSGSATHLVRPVVALQRFAADPELTARATCVDGRRRTAIDLQRVYLALAEKHLDRPFMPPWAADAVAQWRRALDVLEAGGAAAAGRTFDWAIKHQLFTRHLATRGSSWDDVRAMTSVVTKKRIAPRDITGEWRAANRELSAFLELRAELMLLDTRFSLLDDDGLFQTLDQAGVLAHRVPGIDERLAWAMENPPADTRARPRGELVSRHGQTPEARNFVVNWTAVHNTATGEVLDLSNPHETAPAWRPRARRDEDDPAEMFERMHALILGGLPSPERTATGLSAIEAAYERGEFANAWTLVCELETRMPEGDCTGAPWRRLLRFKAWLAPRLGYDTGEEILERMIAGARPSFEDLVDHAFIARHEGLAPAPRFEECLDRAAERLAEEPHLENTAGAYYEHRGYACLRRGDTTGAHRWLSQAVLNPRITTERRLLGRAHADLAETCRCLGRTDLAWTHLHLAEEAIPRQSGAAESADLAWMAAARLARNEPAQAALWLDRALASQRRRGAPVAEARTLLLTARILRRDLETTPAKLRELSANRPALATCPLFNRILTHWPAWTTGAPAPDGHPDEFWGV